jgi:lipopolysaccharide biosynthesis glycosyltransferase
MRSRARQALRRAALHLGPIERLVRTAAEQRQELDDLGSRHEQLRRRCAELEAVVQSSSSELDAVRAEVLRTEVFADFFAALGADGDVSRATVSMTRGLISRPGGTSEARIFAQALQQYDEIRPVAEICLALCAYAEPMPDPAWTLFTRNDLTLVTRWAAEEYFQLGFRCDPDTAAAALARVLSGDVPLDADPRVWIEIAYASFSAGSLDLAARTLERADQAMRNIAEPGRLERLQARLSTLRDWLGRAARATEPVDLADNEVAFALVGFEHPDWHSVSRSLDDFTETLAALGHLLRHESARLVGEPGLVDVATRLRDEVPAELRTSRSTETTVRLYEIDRDVSSYAAIPDGTWVIVSEWFTHPLAEWRYDMPLNPRLRPIFISFHITPDQLRAPGAVDYLRDNGPVGCRDWDTVFLLHAAGVPAFFSGALTTTVNNVYPPSAVAPQSSSALFVGIAPDGPGEQHGAEMQGARRRGLGDNLLAAHSDLRRFRERGARIVTSDARLDAALRGLGCQVEFRLEDPQDYRALDVTALGDSDVVAIQHGISDKLAAVIQAVLDRRPDKEVYEVWRDICAGDVARADTELHRYPGYPELGFDLAAACAAIRATSVVFERTEPGPDGEEINVEFSVDENYKHQLDIVLDSVVERCSRPVRAFVLCRGYRPHDFERTATMFPTVSFVWLSTDTVDHGNVRGKIPWATIVTMDRTILPELLPDVDRIIHFDLDALCLADFAELFDVDMEGKWIAAADEPQPSYGHGFNSLRDSARLLRREGSPELAREYLIRTHSKLRFDFEIFNAGVMVLDLAAMRTGNFCGRYLGYVGRFGINGQRVLNIGVGADRKKLEAQWNRLVRLEVAEGTKVAHWAGPFKPWAGHPYVPGRELWRYQEGHFAARTTGLRPAGQH